MPCLHVPLEEGEALRPVVAAAARQVSRVVIVVLSGPGTRHLSRVTGSVAGHLFVTLGAVVAFGADKVLFLQVAVSLLQNGRRERAEEVHNILFRHLKKCSTA